MAQTIKVLKKNKVDLDNDNITITVTDAVATNTGQDFVDFVRNRNNTSAWLTTDTTDAANTTLEVDMADTEVVDKIILVGHNFKAFTVKYWSGIAWVDFSTPISETINATSTAWFTFDQVSTDKLQIIITGCQTVDEDKILTQLIVGEELAQLEAYPEIRRPRHISNRRKAKMLSGKLNVIEAVGRFSVQLKMKYWNSDADLNAIEGIYFNRVPVLLWLCGGDEDQFKFKRVGYRLEDLYLVRPTNDYTPEWFKGVYTTGLKITVALDEVVD